MKSINVVIDDEEVESPSKGEKTQSFPDELPAPSVDMVKPSSSTQETPVIPLAVDTLPYPHVIPSVADSLPDPTDIVSSGNTASAFEDEDEPTNPSKRSWVKLNHHSRQLIENLEEGRRLRNRVIQPSNEVANQVIYSCYLAQVEPKKVDLALQDESWIAAMHEELYQFTRNDVRTLVPRLSNQNFIGTKWTFKNKSDEHGTVIRNKACLVAQGYTQIGGIDFDETFAPITHLESI